MYLKHLNKYIAVLKKLKYNIKASPTIFSKILFPITKLLMSFEIFF